MIDYQKVGFSSETGRSYK